MRCAICLGEGRRRGRSRREAGRPGRRAAPQVAGRRGAAAIYSRRWWEAWDSIREVSSDLRSCFLFAEEVAGEFAALATARGALFAATADFLFGFGELHVTFGVEHFFGRRGSAVRADFGVLFGFRRRLSALLAAALRVAFALAGVGGARGRFGGGRRFGRFAATATAADFDHLDRRFGGGIVGRGVAGAADQETDSDRQDQRRDTRDQGGVGVHPRRRSAARRRRGRRGRAAAGRCAQRLHEDDRVHERQAWLSPPVPAVEAVALVGRHPRAAVGAGVVGAEGGHRRPDRIGGLLLGGRRGGSRGRRLGLLRTGTHASIIRGRPAGGV